MKKIFTIITTLLLTATFAKAQVETYEIDTAHSGVTFKIRHFVGKTPGSFEKFTGTLKLDRDNLENSEVDVTIEASSIDTNNDNRDEHLNEDDYFHTTKFPVLTFKSTKWEKTGEDSYDITGDLTMLGETHPVTLHAALIGFGEGRNGAFLTGWEAKATIERSTWGFTAGAPAVGDEVEISITVEAIRQDEAEEG